MPQVSGFFEHSKAEAKKERGVGFKWASLSCILPFFLFYSFLTDFFQSNVRRWCSCILRCFFYRRLRCLDSRVQLPRLALDWHFSVVPRVWSVDWRYSIAELPLIRELHMQANFIGTVLR